MSDNPIKGVGNPYTQQGCDEMSPFSQESVQDVTAFVDDATGRVSGIEDHHAGCSVFVPSGRSVPDEYRNKAIKHERTNKFPSELMQLLKRKDENGFKKMVALLNKNIGNKEYLIGELKKLNSVDQARALVAMLNVDRDLANSLLNSKAFKGAADILYKAQVIDHDSVADKHVVLGGNSSSLTFNNELSPYDRIGVYCSLGELVPSDRVPLGAERDPNGSTPNASQFGDVSMVTVGVTTGDPDTVLAYGIERFDPSDAGYIAIGKKSLCERCEEGEAQEGPVEKSPAELEGERLAAEFEKRMKLHQEKLAKKYPGVPFAEAYQMEAARINKEEEELTDGLRSCAGEHSFGKRGNIYGSGSQVEVTEVMPEDVDGIMEKFAEFFENQDIEPQYTFETNDDGSVTIKVDIQGQKWE